MVETTVSALAIGSLAGCLGDASLASDRDADGATAQASFFVFGDFASQVAGDVAASETLVPVGQHGHGWKPGPQIRADVLDANLFVHSVDGFQPWADDVAANVREDGAETALAEVGSNVDLLDAGGHGDGDHVEGVTRVTTTPAGPIRTSGSTRSARSAPSRRYARGSRVRTRRTRTPTPRTPPRTNRDSTTSTPPSSRRSTALRRT